MDSAQLERWSALTRSATAAVPSPLVQLVYWTAFLDLYLRSGIKTPVYLEDALPAIRAILERTASDLFDPVFRSELQRLARSPLLPETPLATAFRCTVENLPEPDLPTMRPFSGSEPDLHVWILLVTTGFELFGKRPDLAIPVPLSVRASRGFHKPGEVVWRSQREEKDPIDGVARQALAAAQREAGVTRLTLAYEIRLGRANLHVRGDSLGLALAAVFHSFEVAARRGRARVLAPDVVVLGSVDEAGSVVPVAEGTLPQKVRAAFGAGFRAIALPAANLESAQRELDSLRALFPARDAPALIGVRSLRELLVSQSLPADPSRPIRKLIARPRTQRIGAAVLLAMFALGASFWFRPRVWLPETTTLIVDNENPRQVRVRLSGFPPRERNWQFAAGVKTAIVSEMKPRSRCTLIVGTGLDGDEPTHVHCYDLQSGHSLWSRDLNDCLDLPPRTRASVTMGIAEIVPTDLDKDDRTDVIVSVTANPMSPCFVYWLRDDGTTRSVYAHRGYLFRIRVEDFDKDGMPEVFMGGTANCDRQPLNQDAAFVVLDSDHFSGWPGDGAFEGSGRAAFDSCRARILFPPIREHCLLLGSPGYHVSNYFVRPSEADPGVMVCIGWSAPGLIVSLDRDFQPVRVVAEDDLRPVVEKALAAGLIAEDFTRPERLERYLAEVKRVR